MIQQKKTYSTYSSACLSGQALDNIKMSWIHTTALAIMTLFNVCINATIFSVALDGSQPYSSIQTAINASAHGDTVLVYPGRYYENVNFNGRNITLASLELSTGNRDYMYSTIIDGNQTGPVIKSNDYESTISIRGFTICNGTGVYSEVYDTYGGGGVFIGRMTGQKSAMITNCFITGNRATHGGGLWGAGFNLGLSGVTIRDNYASMGGGIYYEGLPSANHNTIYDAINRCSIYSNYAASGSDLYYYNVNSVHVIVDTFTVVNPWNFYATGIPSNPNITNPLTFDILNTVHQEVNHDLYVATWGDDSNSGLSPAEPMRSIFMAMYRIASDSENPKTVHVADGTYSSSLNGQQFPIPLKSHTKLMGESKGGVVLNINGNLTSVRIPPGSENCQVSSLVLNDGDSGIVLSRSSDCSIMDIQVRNFTSSNSAAGINGKSVSGTTHIKDITIDNVFAPNYSYGLTFLEQSGSFKLENVNISNVRCEQRLINLEISTRDDCDVIIDGLNMHNSYNYSSDVFSTNTLLQISPFDNYGTRLRIDIRNSAFYDNHQTLSAQMANARSLNDTLFISNCTFAGNTGGSATLAVQGTSVLTNNVFHNPAMNTQIWIPDNTSTGVNSHTILRYNNILGGMSGVYNSTPANPLIWGEGNTDHDPMFSMQGNRPYTLSSGSPLIDSGWQAALAEPGFDAGGNERLWDGDGDGIAIIDKGAYEYQPTWSPINLSAELWNSQLVLSWDMPGIPRGLSGYRIYRNNRPHADIDGAGNTWFRERITEPDTLVYRVAALYGNVESALSDSVVVIVTHVDSSDDLAPSLPSLSVGPNPFTDLAVIRYTLPQAAKVELKIYNLRGQLVRTLDSGTKSAGEQILPWEGCDDGAQALASGVYLLRLKVDGKPAKQMKVVLVK